MLKQEAYRVVASLFLLFKKKANLSYCHVINLVGIRLQVLDQRWLRFYDGFVHDCPAFLRVLMFIPTRSAVDVMWNLLEKRICQKKKKATYDITSC